MFTSSGVLAKGDIEESTDINSDTPTEGVQLGADKDSAKATEDTVEAVEENINSTKEQNLYKEATDLESEEVK